MRPENITPFLVPGRVLRIKTESADWGFGILSNFQKQRITAKNRDQFMKSRKGQHFGDITANSDLVIVLDMYLYTKNKLTAEGTLQPGDPKQRDGRLGLVPIVLSP